MFVFQNIVSLCLLHLIAFSHEQIVDIITLSFKDATEIYTGMELHISARCPNLVDQ